MSHAKNSKPGLEIEPTLNVHKYATISAGVYVPKHSYPVDLSLSMNPLGPSQVVVEKLRAAAK